MLAEPGEGLGRGELPPGDVSRRRGELEPRHLRLVRLPEHLRLRDVHGGVERRGGRRAPVRLVAGEAAPGVGPAGPAADVLEVKVGERLAGVAPHARDLVLRAVAGERRELGPQVVAAARLELRPQGRREARPVVLERVVEVGPRRHAVEARERRVEAGEVPLEGRDRVRVEDVALPAGRGALHLLDRALRDGHGGAPPVTLQDEAGRGVLVADPRPPERPARARREVDPQAEALRLAGRVGEKLHPSRGEERDVAVLPPLRPVDRADLDAPEAGRGQLLELPREVGLVDGAAQPPPARPRPRLACRRRPQGSARTVAARRRRGGQEDESPGREARRETTVLSPDQPPQAWRRPAACSRAGRAATTSAAFAATLRGGEAELLHHDLERGRGAEAVLDADHRAEGARVLLPALRHAGLDRDAGQDRRREDRVAVGLRLRVEQLPRGQADDAGLDAAAERAPRAPRGRAGPRSRWRSG